MQIVNRESLTSLISPDSIASTSKVRAFDQAPTVLGHVTIIAKFSPFTFISPEPTSSGAMRDASQRASGTVGEGVGKLHRAANVGGLPASVPCHRF